MGGGGDDVITAGLFAHGGEGNDTITAAGIQYGGTGDDNLSNGHTLFGDAGDDRLSFGDSMDGGEGSDMLLGGNGQNRFVFHGGEAGHDVVADVGNAVAAYTAWYYGTHLAIPMWQMRASHAGDFIVYAGGYRAPFEDDYLVFTAKALADDNVNYDSGDFIRSHPELVHLIEPLPPLPTVAANDYAALEPFYALGLVDQDTIELPLGVTPENLQVRYKTVPMQSPLAGAVEVYAALEFDLGGGQLIDVLIPHAEDALGNGVEQFRFADGRVLSMGQMLARLGTGIDLDPQNQDNVLQVMPADIAIYQQGNGYALLGLAGNDRIIGSSFADYLEGGTGTDLLIGAGGDDWLDGGEGNDVLEGGIGNDHLAGGAGDDTYRFNLGDGFDTAYDLEGSNTLAFGAGIASADLTLGAYEGAQVIQVGSNGDGIDAINFNFTIVFADGSTLWSADLFARGFDITGTDVDDYLLGTSFSDRIRGNDGNDYIDSGRGDDLLDGGAGDDTYVFGRDYGNDEKWSRKLGLEDK